MNHHGRPVVIWGTQVLFDLLGTAKTHSSPVPLHTQARSLGVLGSNTDGEKHARAAILDPPC